MSNPESNPTVRAIDRVNATLARRYAAERRFRRIGFAAVMTGVLFVLLLLATIVYNGSSAFRQTNILLEVTFDPAVLAPEGKRDPDSLAAADYGLLVKNALRDRFPEVTERNQKRDLNKLASVGASHELRKRVEADPALIGTKAAVWVTADDDIDMLMKGYIDRNLPEDQRRVNDQAIRWVDKLRDAGAIALKFNTGFFTNGDSREPELAGIAGALKGTFYTLFLTLLLSFPVGVAAAIYLEEFAPKNRWTDLVEVNVNNLAAVPSIVFGLLGLAVFINFFGLPRSAPLVGALVLTLMMLPTIIIASRAALKAVPPSIREAALGVGASKMQAVFHHVVPLAVPGMLTGTIIGMAHALGESAPLLMIGMVAFIVDVPQAITDPSTVLPVQIFLWADSPERAFVERTSAAIIVLLGFLVAMNAVAVVLRRKFERRW